MSIQISDAPTESSSTTDQRQVKGLAAGGQV